MSSQQAEKVQFHTSYVNKMRNSFVGCPCYLSYAVFTSNALDISISISKTNSSVFLVLMLMSRARENSIRQISGFFLLVFVCERLCLCLCLCLCASENQLLLMKNSIRQTMLSHNHVHSLNYCNALKFNPYYTITRAPFPNLA